MCGIYCVVDFAKKLTLSDLDIPIKKMAHRGPDNVSSQLIKTPSCSVGLSHARLSIIDLDQSSNQPMRDGENIIIFNGEIYNYLELKEELISKGHIFQTSGDTEVILKLYQQYGDSAFERLNGMFAIVLFDKQCGTLKVVRDRIGVKPLYMFSDYANKRIIFSSELKGIRNTPGSSLNLDRSVAMDFLRKSYIQGARSIYQDCVKVNPGSITSISITNGETQTKTFWDIADSFKSSLSQQSYSDILLTCEDLLKSSVRHRLVADVPVGIFLSGGYDSSLVAALASKETESPLKTFTIGFEEDRYNEALHAARVADFLGTDHHEYYFTAKDAAEIIPRIIEIYDEPFGDVSAIPSILLSTMAKKEVTVCLSADGGDELFAGYEKYRTIKRMMETPARQSLAIAKAIGLGNIDLDKLRFLERFENFDTRYNKVRAHINRSSLPELGETYEDVFSPQELDRFLKSGYQARHDEKIKSNIFGLESDLRYFLLRDIKNYLVDNVLVKVDRATMHCGLEGREPLLDYRLAELAATIPLNYNLSAKAGKSILRDITHKYIPSKLMDRPKKGFGVPIGSWLRNELRDFVIDILSPSKLINNDFLNSHQVISLRDQFLKGSNFNQL